MIEDKITYIYLIENCYNNINKIYIGKNRNGAVTRKYKHSYTFGKNITLTFIDQVNSWDRKDWKPLECYWIDQFRQWGFDVQNKNEGGGGLEKHLDETKSKISKSLLGGKRSEETKLKMRKLKLGNTFRRGQKQSKETIAKRVLKTKGKKRTEEFKIIRSILYKGKSKPKGFGDNVRLRISKPVLKYDLNNNFIQEYKSLTEATRETGINSTSIYDCNKGKQKTAGGFKWKYKN